MGGEKTMYFEDKYFCRGSPPRRRGKEGAQLAEKTGIRITPAWAGKRRISTMTACITRDHPRVGGEKLSSGAYVAKDKGSPPRRRGKGVNVNCSADDIGITPAQAGKSPGSASGWPRRRDHPRAGGEKLMGRPRRSVGAGSPPRRRGKDSSGEPANGSIRITPAQAGKR